MARVTCIAACFIQHSSLAVQTIQNFTNTTLSSFYFDTIKDRLYNEPESSETRRMAQTVLYQVLKSYTTSLAPFVCHTAEEIYENYKAITANPQSSVFKAGWLKSVSNLAWHDFRWMTDYQHDTIRRSNGTMMKSIPSGPHCCISREKWTKY